MVQLPFSGSGAGYSNNFQDFPCGEPARVRKWLIFLNVELALIRNSCFSLCGYGAASPLKRTGLPYLSWSAPGRPSICRPVGARPACHRVFGWARAPVESHVQFCEGFLRFELAQRKHMRFPNAFAQRFLGQIFSRNIAQRFLRGFPFRRLLDQRQRQ